MEDSHEARSNGKSLGIGGMGDVPVRRKVSALFAGVFFSKRERSRVLALCHHAFISAGTKPRRLGSLLITLQIPIIGHAITRPAIHSFV